MPENLENLTTTSRNLFRGRLDAPTRRIIGLIVAIKFIVLEFGFQSYVLFSNQALSSGYWILGIWNRWDAPSYISIALHSYTSTGERRFYIVFFPFYPALIAVFTFVTGDPVLSAVLVSGIASIVLGVLFHRLVRLDFPERIAFSAVWFLFIFPTSYFLHIPYTESVFLALVVGSFYCVRKERWLFAGILGFLACLTRINGLILCLALPFEVWLLWSERKKFERRWLWLALMPVGFLAYLALNFSVTGDAFAFLQIQREHWQKFLTFPWTAIIDKAGQINGVTDVTQKMDGIFELVFVAIGMLGTIIGWRHLRSSYRVWMVASWLLFVSTSFILSVPRYTLTMFPLFIVIALAAKNRIRFMLITACSLLYLALFIISFVQGRWAF